jgi:hypothetical protein
MVGAALALAKFALYRDKIEHSNIPKADDKQQSIDFGQNRENDEKQHRGAAMSSTALTSR